MAPQLTLYGYISSPHTEKVELALKEANIPYKWCSINLYRKPAFFIERINPIGKVPAIAYGGPDVPPEEPSPQSDKLTESTVILEFLADAYPEAKLMPTDPIQRARVRFFMDTLSNGYMPAYMTWVTNREPQAEEKFLEVLVSLQSLLSDGGGYAIGDGYTIADACFTPLINRLLLSVEYDIGKFPVGNGPKFGETLKDPKYAKLMAYVDAITTRQSNKENWTRKKDTVKKDWTILLGRESTMKL